MCGHGIPFSDSSVQVTHPAALAALAAKQAAPKQKRRVSPPSKHLHFVQKKLFKPVKPVILLRA
jgi:hypothetical protein